MLGAGWILVAIWLILQGLRALFGFTFTGIETVLALLALIGGALLIFDGGMTTRRRGRAGGALDVLLLGIYLVIIGLAGLFGFNFSNMGVVLGLLALVAGALLLFVGGRGRARITKNLGLLLLAIYLILIGLIALFGIKLPQSDIILGILALAAGILILIRR